MIVSSTQIVSMRKIQLFIVVAAIILQRFFIQFLKRVVDGPRDGKCSF